MLKQYQQETILEGSNHVAFVIISGLTIVEALKSAKANKWKKAIELEYHQLVDKIPPHLEP